MHSKTKHILIKFHFLREKVAANVFRLEYVATKDQLADIFTKTLTRETFEYLWYIIGVVNPPSKWLHFGRYWQLLSMWDQWKIRLQCFRGNVHEVLFSIDAKGEQDY